MKYQQPGGVLDPDASYDDGDLNVGRAGSIIPAKAVEQPLRELVHLIEYAGLAASDVDLQQVRKAIQALIAAATGGGDVDQYIQMTQARGRLPIFPEILTADGRMNVSSPGAGTILVPPAVSFQHRGVYPISTSDYPEPDRTFATAANKTYHCRWTYGAGFELKDVTDPAYNPTGLPEGNAAFDSTYDDMLIARVVVNGSNVATITNLANQPRLRLLVSKTTTEVTAAPTAAAAFTCNFARTPRAYLSELDVSPASDPYAEHTIGFTRTVDRYGGSARTLGFVPNNPPGSNYVNGTFKLELDA